MPSRWYMGVLSLMLGGCGLELETTSATSEPIIGGSTEVRPGSDAVVFLGECSGALVNADAGRHPRVT